MQCAVYQTMKRIDNHKFLLISFTFLIIEYGRSMVHVVALAVQRVMDISEF